MNRDRVVTAATVALAVALFAVSVLAAYFALREGEGLVTPILSVYLTGLLLAGVLRGTMDTPRWQLAFFAGVAVWGGYEYATAGEVFALLLAGVAVVMVLVAGFDSG
ncbi:hypothetical protein [Halorussus halobius]|uniref:hypothetical protein n=1 Tax=Halorussus halobius TaxID=1710537 RepID=UPI001092F35E|nr:hypothetical protein [Halorussus halobius]